MIFLTSTLRISICSSEPYPKLYTVQQETKYMNRSLYMTHWTEARTWCPEDMVQISVRILQIASLNSSYSQMPVTLCVMLSWWPYVLYVSWTVRTCRSTSQPNFVPYTKSRSMQQGKGAFQRQPNQERGGHALSPPPHRRGSGRLKDEGKWSG